MSDYIKVARSSQVKERFGYAVKIGNKNIALFRHQGQIYALEDRCPHQAAPISEGYVENGYVVCPHHGWKFKLDDGSFIGNELVLISTFPVKEQQGAIYIKLK